MDKLEAKASNTDLETIGLLQPVAPEVEPSEAFREALRHQLLRARFRLLPPAEGEPPLAA